MTDLFFKKPILNSPYESPKRHWELDNDGQPTQKVIESRRRTDFITPIPKPRKRKGQQGLIFDEGKGLSKEGQQYDHTAIINAVRMEVDVWRKLPAAQWRVTPETARLVQHWRTKRTYVRRQPHAVLAIRPFGDYSSQHIRPLAVRPLNHPERVPNPWGFSISGLCKIAIPQRRQP